ncbi:hypothetical protein COV16_07385 [Candidatus Woesearchaeota archaeon CG10_big_fil_rev_8_21_14_0_10_34_8]|nr:MAG: hypothetical protein COV16_07385 [Candidatus Woesearchaeota archaeon CG10_big_fil_rev_8_21_14_0_10_34_8]
MNKWYDIHGDCFESPNPYCSELALHTIGMLNNANANALYSLLQDSKLFDKVYHVFQERRLEQVGKCNKLLYEDEGMYTWELGPGDWERMYADYSISTGDYLSSLKISLALQQTVSDDSELRSISSMFDWFSKGKSGDCPWTPH